MKDRDADKAILEIEKNLMILECSSVGTLNEKVSKLDEILAKMVKLTFIADRVSK